MLSISYEGVSTSEAAFETSAWVMGFRRSEVCRKDSLLTGPASPGVTLHPLTRKGR